MSLRKQVFISSTSDVSAAGSDLKNYISARGTAALRPLGIELAPWHWSDVQPATEDPRPSTIVPDEIKRSDMFIGLLSQVDGSRVKVPMWFRVASRQIEAALPWVQYESGLAALYGVRRAYFLKTEQSSPKRTDNRSWWAELWVRPFATNEELFALFDQFLTQCVSEWINAGSRRAQPSAALAVSASLIGLASVAIAVWVQYYKAPAAIALPAIGTVAALAIAALAFRKWLS